MIRPFCGIGACMLLLSFQLLQAAEPQTRTQSPVESWKDLRFGMFIHWGPVSLKGTEIGWSRGNQVPIEEYDSLYERFDPTRFDAEEWVRLARQAGMKYLVITSKHHDGFCLFETKETDYNIMHTPFGRDVVKELAAACKRQGLAFGIYYSILDWHHPLYATGGPQGKVEKTTADMDLYQVYVQNQLRELSKNYGPLLTFWFDGQWEAPWTAERGEALLDFCRNLDPRIVVNNRVGKGRGIVNGKTTPQQDFLGDYDTPEQRIGAFNNQRPWESCMTLCTQWAWKPGDEMKSLKECVRTLVLTAGGDGNLLFNVGPMPDGRIEPRQAERLRELGRWLGTYGHTIYETRGGPFYPDRWGCSTHKKNVVFVHVFQWDNDRRVLPGLENRVKTASMITGGGIPFEQSDDRIVLTLPVEKQDPMDTVIVLELDGAVRSMAKSRRAPTFLDSGLYGSWISGAATYTMSSRVPKWSLNEDALLKDDGQAPEFAFHTDKESHPHIIIDLGRTALIEGLEIRNRQGGHQKRALSLAAWVSKDKTSWSPVWQSEGVEEEWLLGLDPGVEGRFVKIGLTRADEDYLHLQSVKIYGKWGDER